MKSQSTHFSPPEWKVKVKQFNVWHLDQCSVDLKTGVPAVTTILFAGIVMYSPLQWASVLVYSITSSQSYQ